MKHILTFLLLFSVVLTYSQDTVMLKNLHIDMRPGEGMSVNPTISDSSVVYKVTADMDAKDKVKKYLDSFIQHPLFYSDTASTFIHNILVKIIELDKQSISVNTNLLAIKDGIISKFKPIQFKQSSDWKYVLIYPQSLRKIISAYLSKE